MKNFTKSKIVLKLLLGVLTFVGSQLLATNVSAKALKPSESINRVSNVLGNPTPLVSIIEASGNTTFCSGGNVQLRAASGSSNTGGLIYQWKVKIGAGTATDIPNANSNTYTATTSGSYSLTISSNDPNFTQATSAPIDVVVNAVPKAYSVTYDKNGIVCNGDATGIKISLSNSETGFSYQLTVGGSAVGASQSGTGNPMSFYSTTPGNSYSIVASNTDGSCPVTMNGFVNIKSSPAVTTPIIVVNGTSGSNVTVCTGSNVELTQGIWGYSNYQWYQNDGSGYVLMTGKNVSNITVGTASASYKVMGTNGDGCWSALSDPFSVNVVSPAAAPTIIAPASLNLCNGPITLHSPSADGLNQWFKDGSNTGITTQDFVVSDAASYTLKLGNGNCSSALSTAVVVTKNAPVATIDVFGNQTSACLSGNFFTFSTTLATGTKYSWYFNDGVIATALNNVPQNHSFTQVKDYTVQLDVTTACGVSSATKVISILGKPSLPQITGSSTIIAGETKTLNATYDAATTNVNSLPFGWDITNPNPSVLEFVGTPTSSNATIQVPTALAAGATGTATVKYNVTNTCGTTTATFPVKVTKPCGSVAAAFTPPTAVCLNGSSALTATAITNPRTDGSTYTWDIYDGTQANHLASDNVTSTSYTFTKAGTFDVKLTVTNACGATDYVIKKVTVTGAPSAPIITSTLTNSILAKGASTDLTANSDGADTYTWAVVNPTNSAVTVLNFTTSTTNTFNIFANATGTATVTVKANNAACSLSSAVTSFQVIVPCDNVSAAFTATGISAATPVCASAISYTFTASNIISGSTYTWTFDDGSAPVAATSTSRSFATAGTYNVYLKVVNACGNQDQTFKTFTVKAKPATPQISGSASMVAGASQTLTGTALSTGTTGAWSIINGTTVTGDLVSNQSTWVVTAGATAGTSTVRYTLSNDCGVSSTDFPIVVTVPCGAVAAKFAVSKNIAYSCANNTEFTFDPATSTGAITTYKWYINDGSQPIINSNATPISGYKFTQAGIYDVKLYVENACGSNDEIIKSITVLDKPATPQISGNATMSTLAGSNTQDLTGTADASYTAYNWNVVNPSNPVVNVLSGSALASKYTVTANNAGTAKVTYSVSNGCGTSAITTFPITVTAPCPTLAAVDFSVTATKNGTTDECANTTTYKFTPTSGGSVYKWYINDGSQPIVNNSSADISSYKFTQAGTYDIKLYVENACGNNGEKIKQIIVSDVPATPQITGSSSMLANGTQTLTGTAFTAPTTALWSITGAGLSGGSTTSATYFVTAGASSATPTVTYTLTNGCGSSVAASFPITITKPCIAPSATFTYTALTSPASCVSNNPTISDFTAPDAGTGATYTWYINDGTQLSGKIVSHTFTKAGTFDVKLFVQNACGLNSTTTQQVTILDKPVTPSISGNAAMLLGDVQTLAGTTNETSYTGTWTITQQTPAGVLTTLTSDNASIQIGALKVGSAVVKYNVNNGNGCGASADASFTINVTKLCVKPTAKFTYNTLQTICASTNNGGPSNSVTFTNISTTTGGENLSYIWSWGDGTTDTKDLNNVSGIASIQTHAFTKAGTYTVQLYVSNDCGLNDVYSTNVTVLDVPAKPQAIGGSTNMFIGTSQTLQSYGSTSGVWSITGNSAPTVLTVTGSSSASTLKINAVAAGTPTVVYTVTNTCGTAFVNFPIVVTKPCLKPTATFTASSASICKNSSVTFTNTSVTTSGETLTYTWYYNDGSAADVYSNTQATNPHTFTTPGTYNIKLNVTNNCGLNDEYSLAVVVKDKAATPQQIGGKNAMVIGESQVFTGRANDGSVGNNGTWSIDLGANTVLTTSNAGSANPFTVRAVGSGPAKVKYVTNDNGCGVSDPVYFNVYVSQQPIYVNTYPNPVSGSNLTAAFIAPASGTYTLQICSASNGTPILSATITPTNGAYTTTAFDISSLANGTYVLKISNSFGVISSKIFVKN